MKTIGFAGQFYTLWDVKSERVDVSLGAWYYKVTCTYIKNLSKNLEEAIEKAGTDNLDETLRGKRRSFEYKKPIVVEPTIMTEREELFSIILVNKPENLVEGVREKAFNRALELGYLKEVNGDYSTEWYEDRGYDERGQGIHELVKKISYVAYKWNCPLRYEDTWYHKEMDKFFIGTV